MYETPRSDLLEEKKLRIGGLLLIYKLVNYLFVFLFVFIVGATSARFLIDDEAVIFSLDNLAVNAEFLPSAVFSMLILRLMDKRDPIIPAKIKTLMRYDMLLTFFVGFFIYTGYKQGVVEEKPSPFLGALIYYALWSWYFNKPKRVFEYYGANSSKTKNDER